MRSECASPSTNRGNMTPAIGKTLIFLVTGDDEIIIFNEGNMNG